MVPKWGTHCAGKCWALAKIQTLPLRELNRMVGNQGSSKGSQGPNRVPPPSFLFIDPAPGTPTTKEKADVSEICQYMT